MEEKNKVSREVIESVRLIQEHLDSIRINMDILEVLKLKGRIRLTDKRFIEITELDRKHRKTFQEFVLKELPMFVDGDTQATQKVLKRSFLVWAADLQISLRYLDKITKEFMREISENDKKAKKVVKELEIKDKRFWKFLDKVRTRSKVFESFQEPVDAQVLNQPPDPEKNEGTREREEE
jgi:hypothetical protein